MELTGIAGTIAGYAVMLTAYVALILGLAAIWHYVIYEILLKYVLTMVKIHKYFMLFILNYHSFKKWLKKEQEKEILQTRDNNANNNDDNISATERAS